MRFAPTDIFDVKEVALEPHEDERGWFARVWCVDELTDVGLDPGAVQVNQLYRNQKFTLGGLHLQRPPSADAKYVRCVAGRVFDVAVDLRRESSTYLGWVGRELSASGGIGLYIPEGFAHGYLTLEPHTSLIYWTNQRYDPSAATGVRYDDPEIDVEWPADPVVISEQDLSWPSLHERADL